MSASAFFEKCYKRTSVEEDFEKNRIRCALAAGNVSATLGFVVAGKAKPMTLLKGYELNTAKAKKYHLLLRTKEKCKILCALASNCQMRIFI